MLADCISVRPARAPLGLPLMPLSRPSCLVTTFPGKSFQSRAGAQLITFTLNGKAAYVNTDNATEHPVRRRMDGYTGRQRLTP